MQEEVFIVVNPSLTKAHGRHGTRALNLCLTLCSRRSLNWTHKQVSSLIPSISMDAKV